MVCRVYDLYGGAFSNFVASVCGVVRGSNEERILEGLDFKGFGAETGYAYPRSLDLGFASISGDFEGSGDALV